MKNKITYIIDDDKISSRLMTLLLTKNNFCEEVICFNDASEALKLLKAHSHDSLLLPDVIFVDLNMPNLDGRQFLDAFTLLTIKKKIAVFILSSSVDPTDIQLTEEYKVVKRFLMKPITVSKLSELSLLFEN
jgi:CheY-like chemotaxis protein